MAKEARKKQYNPNKMARIAFGKEVDNVIKNSAIYQLPGNRCEFLSLNNTGMDIAVLRRAYCDMKHKWTVALLVFKINSKGSKVFEVQHVSPPFKCYNEVIAESVEAAHNKMISKCDPKEFIAGGWLAIPRDEIIPNTKLMEIFDGLGVWDDYVTDGGYKLFGE